MRGAAGKGSTVTIMITLTSVPSRGWSAHLSSAGRWSWGRTWTSTPESVALGPAGVTTVGPRQHSISYKWVDVVSGVRNCVCVEGRCTTVYSIQFGVFLALNNTQHHVYTTFKNTTNLNFDIVKPFMHVFHKFTYSTFLCCRTIGRCVTSILCHVVKVVVRKCPEDW